MDLVGIERDRINAEYQRRAKEIAPDLYAPWQAAELLSLTSRRRMAATLLRRASVFPNPGDQCLEIGFGTLGWLGELLTWGLRETDIHGIELDPIRASRARAALPCADLRIGDATYLPWPKQSFQLVIVSTVISSILQWEVRCLIASEAVRVLAPRGALLWYDIACNNPSNRNVLKVDRRELRRLFPELRGAVRSITLAPPLARLIAPWSWPLAVMLETLPMLRTHLLAVLVKEK